MSSAARIVICGGGAIGAAIAYFTSRRGARSTVIERHAVAGAASGKSGGFLALAWCRGSSLDRLARRSFELHAELSAELGDPWGYRRLTTYGGYAVEGDTAPGAGRRPWLADGVAITSRLGSPETTALVEPRAFTTGLMHAAEAHGAVLRHGTVVDVAQHRAVRLSGVHETCRERARLDERRRLRRTEPAGDRDAVGQPRPSGRTGRAIALDGVAAVGGQTPITPWIAQFGGKFGMKLEAPPRQSIERAAAAQVQRQKAARLAGRRTGDGVTLDDVRPRAASACEVRNRG